MLPSPPLALSVTNTFAQSALFGSWFSCKFIFTPLQKIEDETMLISHRRTSRPILDCYEQGTVDRQLEEDHSLDRQPHHSGNCLRYRKS
jgi:hypothetical protein